MSNNFSASARISLDIRAFAQGAQAVTKSGGEMEKIFTNLNQVMGKVALVEADLAAKLRQSLTIYNQISSAAKNYATAVTALQKAEASGADGAQKMIQAFTQLRAALSQVEGLGKREYDRISRTLVLYERMARAIATLANAQKSMSQVTENAAAAQRKQEEALRKAEESARRLALEEQKLANQQEKLVQSAQRLAQAEQRVSQARTSTAQGTRAASQATITMTQSSFGLRNTVGELEQSFQSLYTALLKIPVAMAQAAISQEAAFAQVRRVVGDTEAAAAGLLQRFHEIAATAPISFEEVSRIGQLGAAIGVSAENLGDFTDTIVKFSLTTGVASDEATLLLGRIAQMQDVPISQIEQLGSAILALGTASAATDQEILRVNASIATASNLFGLTAQETSGLAAALATLQVRPELSRGALTRVFNDLSLAVSEGGVELEKLAKVMNMTSTEVANLANNPATRGDFLLAFIDGLSNAAMAGGEVQGVLRELGINAVRDIDVFSKLANNVDVVRESFDRANLEFARGTELQRQSKTIYETTSAEIQNLGDAFKGLLATLGGPLGSAIGDIASGLSDVIQFFTHLGPVLPVFGTLTAVVVAGAAGWALYQVALAKTISTMIATKELQKSLGVNTLTLATAMKVHRGELTATTAAQSAAANSARVFAASTGSLTASLAASAAGQRAYAAAAVSTANGMNVMSAATVLASRNMNTMFAAAASQRGALMQLNAASAATAVAMTGVANSNRAVAVTQAQSANASRVYAQQTAIAGAAVQGLNTRTVAAVPVMNTMGQNMNRAAQAGATLGSGMGMAGAAAGKASTVFTTAATATAKTGAAARVAAFAFGPWGLAIAAASILLGPMVAKMFDFSTASEKLRDAAYQATGGTQALANAIRADTDAAIAAAGGAERYAAAVRDGSKEALSAIGVYSTITVTKNNLADADRRTAEAAKASAQEQLRAIEATKGSEEALRAQAKGHGTGAEAAKRYLREIDKAKNIVKESTAALGENTQAIGENVKQWLLDTAQVLVQQSKLADGSKLSARAIEQMAEAGVNVGEILTLSLEKPDLALKKLDEALKGVKATADNYAPDGGRSGLGEQLLDEAAAASRLKDFLEALREVAAAKGSEATKLALAEKLLKDALDSTGDAAQSASGRIKLTRENLEDLNISSEEATQAIEQLGQSFEKFGTPMDAFSKAAKSTFKDASDAVEKFSLKSKGGLDSYIRELEKIAKAQKDWATNLIKIAATLGPDVAEQFRKLGPEAAPAVEELANLSAAELEKLGPKLALIGSEAISDLSASIVQSSGKIENATIKTREVISNILGTALDKTTTAAQFTEVANQYEALVAKMNKSKDVKFDISANDAKALKSLSDISLYIDLVSSKKVSPEVAIDVVKARGDVEKIQAVIAEAVASGKLDAKGKAFLNDFIYKGQMASLQTYIKTIEAERKLDAEGKGKLTDDEYKAKVEALIAWLASKEAAGLLNPSGDAVLNDDKYRKDMEGLASTILGKEAVGEFDVDGNGILSDAEFVAVMAALRALVARVNKDGSIDPTGYSELAGTQAFKTRLNGIVEASWAAGSQITQALTRSATVSVGYYYYQKNSPPRTMAAATGGWISGPGGPTSDSVPMMLSNGEFVVNAAAASRFGALLEIINRSGGRGFSGVAKRLLDSGVTGGSKQVRVRQGGASGTFFGGNSLVAQVPPESVSVMSARMAAPQQGPSTVLNINNQYPQAEPTSTTINRSLAYAATISGV